MKLECSSSLKIGKFFLGALLSGVAADSLCGQVFIDGQATIEDGYTVISSQNQLSGMGHGNVLASLRYVQTPNKLNLMIAGRATNNAIILFVDAKPGGVSRIRPDLIQDYSGREQDLINYLARSQEEGMTFEDGFEPEIAIRISGDDTGGVKHARVNLFDLVDGTQMDVGDAHAGLVSAGPVTGIRVDWQNVGLDDDDFGAYANHSKGVEMALNLSGLGVVGGRSVKVSAILVSKINYDPINGDSFEGSNQVLGPLVNQSISGLGSDVAIFNFQQEDGEQTVSIPVSGLSPTGDEDLDGLTNLVETGTGVFVGASDTGSNPESADTDGDGYPDGAEVNGTSVLGYVSDPNWKNEAMMSVAGSFNGWLVGQAATAMTRESTTLAGQHKWSLAYNLAPGNLTYKFTAQGQRWWGLGAQVGIAATPGNDIPRTVALSGMHRFFIDLRTLAHSLERVVFANRAEYLATYGLADAGDADGDGVSNGDEFLANTDPTRIDTDGDGYDDSLDNFPLAPGIGPAGYEIWASNLPLGVRGRGADADGDGFSNLQEFLFGTPANQPGGSLCHLIRTDGGLTMIWLQRDGNSTYSLLKSSSPGADEWIPSGINVVSDSDQTGVPLGYVRKSASVPISQQRMFFRLAGNE